LAVPDGLTRWFAIDGTIQATAVARFGFDCHWPHEIAHGATPGDLAVIADGGSAALDLSLTGTFIAHVCLDARGWLRLRLFKRTGSAPGLGWDLRVRAAPLPASPAQSPEQLALAILGVHDGQWLEAQARLAEADPGRLQARFGAAAPGCLDLWRSLGARPASILWSAAGGDRIAPLRDWVQRLATELRDPEHLQTALNRILESTPDFAATSAGLWTEAASGGPLASLTSPARFERLLSAADAASHLLGDPELAAVLVGLKRHALDRLGFARVQRALSMPAAFDFLDGWLRAQLRDFFGSLDSDADLARALHKLRWILELARSLDAKALTALERQYSAELACRSSRAQAGDALLDCSFDFTAQGLSAYRAAIGGDFSFLAAPPSPHVHRHRALLTHGLSRLANIELHLPFLGRKQWRRRSEALARVEIETGEDGRLFVYPAETSGRADRKSQYQGRLMLSGALPTGDDTRFTLTFTDRRSHSLAQARLTLAPLLRTYGFDSVEQDGWPRGGLQSSLTISLPGPLTHAWLRAPGERAPDFFEVYSAVSVTLQRVLRQWLPYVYFNDLDRYDDLDAAFPLLVYRSMRPFPSVTRSQFTYDILSPDSPEFSDRTTYRALLHELRRTTQLLLEEGRSGTARFYAPDQARHILASVQYRPALLNSLLTADAFLVDSLVSLGVKGRQLGEALSGDPRKAAKELAKFSNRFVAAFHRRLRRLYRGQNLAPLGSLLLLEATRTLNGNPPLAGVLHLTLGQLRQTFVNPAYSLPPPPPIHLP
jgi:hypothetical protein